MGDGEHPAVAAEAHDAGKLAGIIARHAMVELPGTDSVEVILVQRGRHQPATIGTERRAGHIGKPASETSIAQRPLLFTLAGLCIPDPDVLAVKDTGGNPAAVRADRGK